MPVGATLGAAAIGGGLGLWGAKKAADANKYATDAQVKAADSAAVTQAASAKEALDFAKGVYSDRRADLSPYSQVGASSINTLSGLMGLPAPQAKPAPAQPNPLPMDPNHIPPGQNFPASWVPGSPSYTGPPRQNAVMGQSNPSTPPGSVLMEAPDGSRKMVPAAFVQMAIAKKARVVDAGGGGSPEGGSNGYAA